MGAIAAKEYELKSGEKIVIRSVMPEEADAVLDYVRKVLDESEYFLTLPDEFTYTLDEEKELIKNLNEHPCGVVLAADVDGTLAGLLMLVSDKKRRLAHTVTLHISILKEWRNRGMGSALIRELIEWAENNTELEKICLGVFSTNDRAIRLYKNMGFIEEGRRERQYKISPGEYVDEVLMARFVK